MSNTPKEEATTENTNNSEGEKVFVHPLQKNDPILVKHVDFVTLEFLERAKHPIPKNQRLNKQEAFGELTGRSVLVALSHGWFYQMHPDPHAVKIDIIVKEFGPRLEKRIRKLKSSSSLIFSAYHMASYGGRR